jgi:hypothetical protein
MVMINIPDDIAQELKAMAERKNRPIDEIAASYIRDGISSEKIEETHSQEAVHPLDSILGMLDDDVTDMSTTVKETMREYYKNKRWKSDDV